MQGDNEWQEVFRTTEQVEAQIVRGLLEANGFPVVVEAKGLKAMPVIFGHAAAGELVLKVPAGMAQTVKELLAAKADFPDPE